MPNKAPNSKLAVRIAGYGSMLLIPLLLVTALEAAGRRLLRSKGLATYPFFISR